MIAQTAWLLVQFEQVREQVAKQGHFLTRKEFLDKPGFTVALTPVAFLAVIKAQIPFKAVLIMQQQPVPLPQNGRPSLVQ